MHFKITWILTFVAFGNSFLIDFNLPRHLTLYEENGEIVVSNCTCGTCEGMDLNLSCQNSPDCTNMTSADIGNVVQDAKSALTPSWIYASTLTICCNSLNSNSARSTLFDLLDYALITSLDLYDCGGLVSSTSTKDLAVYGLQILNIYSENKTATLNMATTDLSVPKLIEIFLIRSVAFLSTNIFDLKSDLKAFSFIAEDDPSAITETLAKAFNRSPFRSIFELDFDFPIPEIDNQYMVTPIYL